MHYKALAILLIVLLVILAMTHAKEGFQEWIDFDIARDAPDPRHFLYVYREKDQLMNTPVDYYLQNKMYQDQGVIAYREGWDKYRPSTNTSLTPAYIGKI